MAKVVKQFDFERGSARRLYDWDKWLDGRIWQLDKGVDFTISASSLRIQAQSAAKSRGLKIRTKVTGDTVTVQAFKES